MLIATSLLGLVRRLSPRRQATEWGTYVSESSYDASAVDAKTQAVRDLVKRVRPRTVWDVGANDGRFSHAVRDLAAEVVALDLDPNAVNRNYLRCRRDGVTNVTPLVVDLTNPSPAIGFANQERPMLADRGRPDLVMALALIHHLARSQSQRRRWQWPSSIWCSPGCAEFSSP
jgi:2-polyprenyl-3-methyl-5-hydroxy-6-metoxy-1,4-benzoquinol methylase